MPSRSPHQRATDEAQRMRVRGERTDQCVLGGVHDPHVMRTIRRKGGKSSYGDLPCGSGMTTVDKEADSGRWDRPGN